MKDGIHVPLGCAVKDVVECQLVEAFGEFPDPLCKVVLDVVVVEAYHRDLQIPLEPQVTCATVVALVLLKCFVYLEPHFLHGGKKREPRLRA